MNTTLSPQDLAETGKKSFEQHDYWGAAKAFQAAAEGYGLADDVLSAAEMNNNRSVALLKAGDPSLALEAVEGTASMFADHGDSRRQALAFGNEAAARDALGQVEEAERMYRESADILGQIGEDDLQAAVLRSISELQLRSGRHFEAVASMQAGLDGLDRPSAKQRLIRKLLDMPYKFLNRS